ncbi:hypothetical protein [Bacillus alkalicellulosilyticus]|uniref:hypothetical protein n=1 Tax=Alkalihalobacterium alkalicellulosilyticum TaxID=1912214 RepID=UPI000997F3EE|nr:hypothetical protein [Bacillus alkalicellulosilyticus]
MELTLATTDEINMLHAKLKDLLFTFLRIRKNISNTLGLLMFLIVDFKMKKKLVSYWEEIIILHLVNCS